MTRAITDTTPYWTSSATFPPHAKLSEDVEADVLVVGGGSTGLTAAYLLAREPGFGAAAGVALLIIAIVVVALSTRLGREQASR